MACSPLYIFFFSLVVGKKQVAYLRIVLPIQGFGYETKCHGWCESSIWVLLLRCTTLVFKRRFLVYIYIYIHTYIQYIIILSYFFLILYFFYKQARCYGVFFLPSNRTKKNVTNRTHEKKKRTRKYVGVRAGRGVDGVGGAVGILRRPCRASQRQRILGLGAARLGPNQRDGPPPGHRRGMGRRRRGMVLGERLRSAQVGGKFAGRIDEGGARRCPPPHAHGTRGKVADGHRLRVGKPRQTLTPGGAGTAQLLESLETPPDGAGGVGAAGVGDVVGQRLRMVGVRARVVPARVSILSGKETGYFFSRRQTKEHRTHDEQQRTTIDHFSNSNSRW